MANPRDLEILLKGVEIWNEWRTRNPDIIPDLSGLKFVMGSLILTEEECKRLGVSGPHELLHAEKNLVCHDFQGANFGGTNFSGSDLRFTNLSESILMHADLSHADLSEANLQKTSLLHANLHSANLSKADLRNTLLYKSDFSSANLSEAVLSEVSFSNCHINFSKTILRGAILEAADLSGEDLAETNLSFAQIAGAKLVGTNLQSAILNGANLSSAQLYKARLNFSTLDNADLRLANLIHADLSGASLRNADLSGADLSEANLSDANLVGANLRFARLIRTDLTNADISNSVVFGVSSWGLKLNETTQANLVITYDDEPVITVDNLEVAQFIYLLLNNHSIRRIIDTVTQKAVLILGRFTPERKVVLDYIRGELRNHDYLPMLFDFDIPESRDVTETITLLARMSRFIIADLTEPSSVAKELEAIVPHLAVPVQPLIEGRNNPYSMFKDYWKYPWVLEVCRYEGLRELDQLLRDRVIVQAEEKVRELLRMRNNKAESDIS